MVATPPPAGGPLTQQQLTVAEEQRAKRARATMRRARALELRLSGKTYEAIGVELGVSKNAAYQMVRKVLAKREAEARETSEQLRQIDLARTEALIVAVWDRATDPSMSTVDVPADNERGCKPYDAQDKAIDRVTRLLERRAKLMGLDTPTTQKLEHTGPGGAPVNLPPHIAILLPKAEAGDVEAKALVEAWLRGGEPPALPAGGSDT